MAAQRKVSTHKKWRWASDKIEISDSQTLRLHLGSGQSVLCSSLADQVSWESKRYQNSVFTKQLMEALQCKGTATTLTDAYNYLKDAVEQEVLRDQAVIQTPILNTKLWTGGDAVVAIKAAKPRKGL